MALTTEDILLASGRFAEWLQYQWSKQVSTPGVIDWQEPTDQDKEQSPPVRAFDFLEEPGPETIGAETKRILKERGSDLDGFHLKEEYKGGSIAGWVIRNLPEELRPKPKRPGDYTWTSWRNN